MACGSRALPPTPPTAQSPSSSSVTACGARAEDRIRAARYTKEFKRHAIALADSSGKTVTAVARELGISSESLHGWYRRAQADQGEGAPGELTSAEREELRRCMCPSCPLCCSGLSGQEHTDTARDVWQELHDRS